MSGTEESDSGAEESDGGLASILASIRATINESASESAPPEGEPENMPPRPAALRPPAPPASRGPTVTDFLADLVRPQIAAWLDAHLPEIVQKMVQEEVERLTGKAPSS